MNLRYTRLQDLTNGHFRSSKIVFYPVLDCIAADKMLFHHRVQFDQHSPEILVLNLTERYLLIDNPFQEEVAPFGNINILDKRSLNLNSFCCWRFFYFAVVFDINLMLAIEVALRSTRTSILRNAA